MPDINIHVQRDIVDWPLHQSVNTDQLIKDYGISVTETVGENLIDLTNKLNFNLTNVNIDKEGQYAVQLNVLDANGNTAEKVVQLNIRPMREQKPAQATTPPHRSPSTSAVAPVKAAKPKHSKKWLMILLAILVVLIVIFGLRSCQRSHKQARIESSQSSQIARNSSSINKLNDQNQAMKNQLEDLQNTVEQYQDNQDKAALQDQINQLRAQNQALQANAKTQIMQARVNGYNDALNNISNNPDDAEHYLSNLSKEWYFQPYSDWLNNAEEHLNL